MGALLNRRRYMGGGSAPLPYDAEVEYLENSGTQKINSGILLKAGDYPTYNIDCELLQKNTRFDSAPIGYYYISGGIELAYVMFAQSSDAIDFKFVTTIISFNGYSLNERYKIVANSSSGTYVNNVLVTASYLSVNKTSRYGIYIFVNNANGNTKAEYFIGRIYSCQIIVNDEIVRDYIPVRVGQTGYMYDRVSGTLFGNSGTGDFVLGPDKT